MPLNPLDRTRLQEALALAEQSIGLSDPNPRVGCILGRPDGTVLGRGFTQEAGGPHAEVVALREARASGADLRGATAWVTLEPCAHHGRTPPCCDALIEAGVGRVVIAVGDPNPLVAGQGIARLRAAGIEVVLADEELATVARELNIGFFSRMERGRPWVRLKVAMSLDGVTVLPNGISQWITGEEARVDGHRWRRRAGAILTGIGTVLADDPRLDVRYVPVQRQPLRVVLDSGLRTPPTARILRPPGVALIASTTARSNPRRSVLQDAGAEVADVGTFEGRVDAEAVLVELARRAVNEVHVESGAKLNGALLARDLVDELLVYIAPHLAGGGTGPAELEPLSRFPASPALCLRDSVLVGRDLRVTLRRSPSPGMLPEHQCRHT